MRSFSSLRSHVVVLKRMSGALVVLPHLKGCKCSRIFLAFEIASIGTFNSGSRPLAK